MSVITCAMNGGRAWSLSSSLPWSLEWSPPSYPSLWRRPCPLGSLYIRMCGEIDEEITVPGVVRKKPFVLIRTMCTSLATKSKSSWTPLAQQVPSCNNWLPIPLLQYLQNCQALSGQIGDDELLNDPQYLSLCCHMHWSFFEVRESTFPNNVFQGPFRS